LTGEELESFYLFTSISGLFKEAVSVSDYVVSNGMMIGE
jgi:hypothetical protein